MQGVLKKLSATFFFFTRFFEKLIGLVRNNDILSANLWGELLLITSKYIKFRKLYAFQTQDIFREVRRNYENLKIQIIFYLRLATMLYALDFYFIAYVIRCDNINF